MQKPIVSILIDEMINEDSLAPIIDAILPNERIKCIVEYDDLSEYNKLTFNIDGSITFNK